MSHVGIIQQGKEIQVLRREDGEYVNGFFQIGRTVANFIAVGSVQPLTGRERLQLPEGDRDREHLNIWTEDDIRVDDTLIVNCKEFEVRTIDDWENQGLSLIHRRVLAILKDVNKERTDITGDA